MRADGYVVFLTRRNGLLHDQRVARVESTRDVCMVNEWDEFVVWPAFEVAISLS
jgi:hypothetical protein